MKRVFITTPVAEIKFKESVGRRDEVPFEDFMEGIGENYVDWLKKKQVK